MLSRAGNRKEDHMMGKVRDCCECWKYHEVEPLYSLSEPQFPFVDRINAPKIDFTNAQYRAREHWRNIHDGMPPQRPYRERGQCWTEGIVAGYCGGVNIRSTRFGAGETSPLRIRV